jgi:transcriptional regulator of acetoin/glycerol metabolism
MIAVSIDQFDRMSRKLGDSPHVLSLTDGEGIVLYSHGTTGMVHEQGRTPGANWSCDFMGPSAAARAIAAGVPLIIVGTPGSNGVLAVRMGCPIRLGDGHVAGVVVLTMDLSPARAEHLIEIAKMSRKICKVVEEERKKPSRAHARSQVQPFEEAEVHLARVMSMPQIDNTTRSHLASVLAELEEKRREFLLRGNHSSSGKKARKGNARAQGV